MTSVSKVRSPFSQFMLVVHSARKRAKQKGLTCELSLEESQRLWERCKGACELTGIPFDFAFKVKGQRRPFAPSIDRVANGKGYSVDNVRVVCSAVNIAMNQWGEEVLYKIALSLLANGRMPHMVSKLLHPTAVPQDVRVYRGAKCIKYQARVRDLGVSKSLGFFFTIDDALAARRKWAVEHGSAKVLGQIFSYNKDPEVKREIEQTYRQVPCATQAFGSLQ